MIGNPFRCAHSLGATFALALAAIAPPLAAAPGDPLSPEYRIDQGGTFDPLETDVAVRGDGAVLGIWTDGGRVRGRYTDAGGTPLSGVLTLVSAPGFNVTNLSPQSLAMAPDGHFVIVYERGLYGGRLAVFAQRFDPAGAPLGEAIQVSARLLAQDNRSQAIAISSLVRQRDVAPAVGMDAQGNFVVAWTSREERSSNPFAALGIDLLATQVMVQRYRADGTAVGQRQTVQSALDATGITRRDDIHDLILGYAPSELENARIGVQADGSFAVSWQRRSTVPKLLLTRPAYEYGLEFRAFRANGYGYFKRVLVSGSQDPVMAGDVAPAGSDYLVAWSQDGSASLQRLAANGDPAGTLFTVPAQSLDSPQVISSSVAANANGAVWTYAVDSSDTGDLMTQLLDGSGSILGAPFSPHAPSQGHEFAPHVVAGPDGSFTIGWSLEPGRELRARRMAGP